MSEIEILPTESRPTFRVLLGAGSATVRLGAHGEVDTCSGDDAIRAIVMRSKV